MSLAIEVRRTDDLSGEDPSRLCSLFQDTFGKAFPEELFSRKYTRAWPGYSYHALTRSDSGIVGAYSAIPYRYSFFGREMPFAIGVDLMLESRFRGNVGTVRRMSDALYACLADAGIVFVFGSAREDMFLFHQRVGGWREIGPVFYYIAPLRVPRVPGAAALLRTLIRLARLAAPGRGEGVPPPGICKIDDSLFEAYRYGIFPTEYRKIEVTGGQGIYTGRLYYEIPGIPKNIRVSLLVDVRPLSRVVFNETVRAIMRCERNIDYLVYQGWLPFQPALMWRVPRGLERVHWYACGRILRPDMVDERIYDIRNWNLNLSNGDIV